MAGHGCSRAVLRPITSSLDRAARVFFDSKNTPGNASNSTGSEPGSSPLVQPCCIVRRGTHSGWPGAPQRLLRRTSPLIRLNLGGPYDHHGSRLRPVPARQPWGRISIWWPDAESGGSRRSAGRGPATPWPTLPARSSWPRTAPTPGSPCRPARSSTSQAARLQRRGDHQARLHRRRPARGRGPEADRPRAGFWVRKLCR
jgi:hypothetical protein